MFAIISIDHTDFKIRHIIIVGYVMARYKNECRYPAVCFISV